MLLSKVKEVCDAAIRLNHKNYGEIFTTRQELEALRDSFKTTFLSSTTFRDYCKSQEARLKGIDEKLNHRFSLPRFTLHNRKDTDGNKSYIPLESIINLFKRINTRWLLSVLVFLSIVLIAVCLYSSISD